jgi:hypothetical protein
VYAGAPTESSGFGQEQVDGLKVYWQKNMQISHDGIKIDLVGFGPFKQLIVDGVKS